MMHLTIHRPIFAFKYAVYAVRGLNLLPQHRNVSIRRDSRIQRILALPWRKRRVSSIGPLTQASTNAEVRLRTCGHDILREDVE